MVLWFSLMDMVELSHAKAFNVKKAKVKALVKASLPSID